MARVKRAVNAHKKRRETLERAAEEAEEHAERDAARALRPIGKKKERGRSENLDPEIEA